MVVALVAYIPQLLAQPGVVVSDTKSYLYLDPGRFLAQSMYMWYPGMAAGTVTHERIGYLFPMGPFFLATRLMGIPLWVAERLWMGSILLAAGAGVLYMAHVIGINGPGRIVAALAYMISPYFLQYVGRESVITLAWAGLPFMIAYAEKSLRNVEARRAGKSNTGNAEDDPAVTGSALASTSPPAITYSDATTSVSTHSGTALPAYAGNSEKMQQGHPWRYPALFAIVVATVSGINATAILYLGLAPVLWIIFQARVTREHDWKTAWGAVWRIGLLTTWLSLWWAAGLQVEAGYGINVLKYTETVPAVASSSLASEVLRGLGYWYFYGGGRLGPWVVTSVEMTQHLSTLAFSFAVPALAFLSAIWVSFRYRSYFAFLVAFGMVFAVGTYPYLHPSLIGELLKLFMTRTTAGFAIRSTDRATPMVILGTSILLGLGVTALWKHRRAVGLAAAALCAAGIALANPAVWNGTTVPDHFTQPHPLPSYEYKAASWLDTHGKGTRVLVEPGEDFAAYRWGDTIDTIYPGISTRQFIVREQLIMGSLPTADMMYAIDSPIQEGAYNWKALAPMARLFSAGDLLVQNNLQYERYGMPHPRILWQHFLKPIPGLGAPIGFGKPVPNRSAIPWVDEQVLKSPANLPWPSPVEVLPVKNPRPIVRAESTSNALVVDGDASGIADAASVGLLNGNPAVLYAGTLDSQPGQLASAMKQGAVLVVTDSNKKRAFKWDLLHGNVGYTETASEHYASKHPSDAPLRIFGQQPASAMTTAKFTGDVSSVTASSYGNAVAYSPEYQPAMAIDGNLNTSWQVAAFGIASGQWWQLHLRHPVTAGQVNLVQPFGSLTRYITKVTLFFSSSKHPNFPNGSSAPDKGLTVDLNAASLTPQGQTITFHKRSFTTVRIRIDRTNRSQLKSKTAVPPVGFSEIRIPGISTQRYLAMPKDLLTLAGPASIHNRLVVIMDRHRLSPYPPHSDPEHQLQRILWLPGPRRFAITGTARISTLIPDNMINQLVGVPGSNGSGIVAYSNGRLPGDLRDTASAALSGQPSGKSSVMWSPGFGQTHQIGDWIEVNTPAPVTLDHLNMSIVADGYHSVPTSMRITNGRGQQVNVNLPPIANRKGRDSTALVPLSFPPISGMHLRFTFTGVRFVYTKDYYSSAPIAMPLGIASLGIPGVTMPPPPKDIPAVCRKGLVSIDGNPVWLEITGSSSTALSGGGLQFKGCGPDAGGVKLGAGNNTITSANGHASGFNIDRLVLDSAPGGGPELPASPTTALNASGPSGAGPATGNSPGSAAAPVVKVLSKTPVSMRLEVRNATKPFWLVLGESHSLGWQASVQGSGNLPPPELMDGFANGWLVNPAKLTSARNGAFYVTLNWQPQNNVWIALWLSALGFVLCLIIVAFSYAGRKRRRAYLPRSLRRHFSAGNFGRETSRNSVPVPGTTMSGEASTIDRPAGIEAVLPVQPENDSMAARTAGMPTQTVVGSASNPRDGMPTLTSPLSWQRKPVRWWSIPLVAAITGLLGGAASTPEVGAGLFLAVLACMIFSWGRTFLTLTALTTVVATGTYMVYRQAVERFLPGAGWAPQFATASTLTWIAVIFLAADAMIIALLGKSDDSGQVGDETVGDETVGDETVR